MKALDLMVYNLQETHGNILIPMATANPFPAPEHNHGDCVQKALQTADQICRERHLRLTATRRRVLELVWTSHKPVGAYEILDALGNSSSKPILCTGWIRSMPMWAALIRKALTPASS